ncbi:sugar ABC transporter substrate-binding protein [Oscillospiraceae bacterium PP1C4]
MKRSLRLLSGLLAVMMLFAACQNKPTAGGDSAASGKSPAAATSGDAASGEPITLRMIESLTSASRTAVLREIADEYQSLHKNVTIEIISPPLEGADEKIAQMLMAKQELDIVEVREQMVTQFSNNKWIIPLDDYVAKWDEKDTLTAAATQSMTAIGGKAYLVPSGFYQRCLFYRKDIFDAAGLQPPTTWEGILEVGEKLTNASENKYGYAFRGGTGGNQYAEMLFLSWLGVENIADPNAAFFLKDGKGATIFTRPEVKKALEFHKELYKKASPSDSVTWAFSEMVQGFMNGTAAMLIQDSEVIANCEAELKPEQWGVQVMPAGPTGQAVFPNGYGGWGITSYSKNTDAAADFLLFLSNSNNNTKYAKSQALIPIHSDATKDKFFSEGPFSVYMEMSKKPEVYKFAVRPQMYQAFASYKVEIDQEIQKYLKDTITADELLAHFDKFWSEAYKTEGEQW